MMPKPIVKIIQALLIPAGILYGILMQIRNRLYDRGVFKSESFAVPLISVGNITAGGSGKTPFTIFLARQLSAQFQKIAIVSRGYGRKSSGLQLVAAEGRIYLDAEQAGDEPFLLARALANSVVVVSEKRAEGVRLAIEKFQVDLVILDDAFQHRSLKRDLDIVLINSGEPWKWNFPMPAGTLREFKFNYKRAQLIVFTNTKENTVLPFLPEGRPFFKSSPQLKEVVGLDNKIVGHISDFRAKRVLAFAGIAHPQNFKTALREAGIEVAAFSGFSDHYRFSEKKLQQLFAEAQNAACEILLCTEKDLGKIQTLNVSEFPLPLRAVRLNLQFDAETELIKTITEQV